MIVHTSTRAKEAFHINCGTEGKEKQGRRFKENRRGTADGEILKFQNLM